MNIYMNNYMNIIYIFKYSFTSLYITIKKQNFNKKMIFYSINQGFLKINLYIFSKIFLLKIF